MFYSNLIQKLQYFFHVPVLHVPIDEFHVLKLAKIKVFQKEGNIQQFNWWIVKLIIVQVTTIEPLFIEIQSWILLLMAMRSNYFFLLLQYTHLIPFTKLLLFIGVIELSLSMLYPIFKLPQIIGCIL